MSAWSSLLKIAGILKRRMEIPQPQVLARKIKEMKQRSKQVVNSQINGV